MKDFRNKTDLVLHSGVATTLRSLQGRVDEFGLSDADIAILTEANELFGGNIENAQLMEGLKRSAVEEKNVSRGDVVSAINTLAKKVYANPAVDDEMLSSIGLAVRPNYRTRTHPVAPTPLVALPQGDGGVVLLRWKRNGNSEHTIFTIWAQGDGEPERIVGSTKATKMKLEGFTPGVAQYFHVTATVNGETSDRSNTGSIYAGMSARKAA